MTRGKSNRFLLLYASQTGQAKAIAEEVADKAVKHGLHADIHCVSNTEKKFWLERESCVVFISSTTGEGEPPDTALKFWRRLKKKTLPDDHLKQLNYILLGLGDSNYTNFCNFAKSVDRRLEELGAKKIIPSTFADDAVGLEVAVEPWLDDQIFPALSNHLGLTDNLIFNEDPVTVNGDKTSDTAEPNRLKDKPSDMALTVDISQNGTSSAVNMENKQNMPLKEISDGTISTVASNVKEGNPNDLKSLDSIQSPESQSVTSAVEEDLVHSLPPLSESALNIPACPPRFLALKYDLEVILDVHSLPVQNDYPFPSAKTEIQHVSIASAEVLTRHDSVKTTMKLTLDISTTEWTYEPGDSFGIVCMNPDHEVEQLLKRLEVLQYADCTCELSLIRDTKKRNAAIPAYLSERGTLRYWFTTSLDIRSVPKKAFLRALVEYTADPAEKRRLQELCSKQGAEHYTRYLRQPDVGLADVLMHFPSCQPPVELLLEHLPRLLPRSYSSTSCLKAQPGCLEFVFNVIDIPAGCGRIEDKQGICTGMLKRLSKPLLKDINTIGCDITEDMKTLRLDSHIQIPVFLRGNQSFHPPADLSVPLIMIGPGTGVAPFIGFLQQRELCIQSLLDKSAVGETWLFFGCHHKDRDYIFRKELEYFEEKNVLTHLKVCFSRDHQDDDMPRYVQDNMLLYSQDIVTLILEKGSEVFVCGDANNMAKDVKQAFVKMIQSERGLSAKEAESAIFDMLLNRRYHEDVWS